MIPTDETIQFLWEKYFLPPKKRIHVRLVADVSDLLARMCMEKSSSIHIDLRLLHAAALLHDIDNGIVPLPGEVHPDACVRILRDEGYAAVADLVKTHSLYAILDAGILHDSWDKKVLYFADKMVKYEVITVDKRFALWRNEPLPIDAIKKMEVCYPLVKTLEGEICSLLSIEPEQIASLVRKT